MTKKELQEFINLWEERLKVMRAGVEDMTAIQYRTKGYTSVWKDCIGDYSELTWDWSVVEYRIRPKSLMEELSTAYPALDMVYASAAHRDGFKCAMSIVERYLKENKIDNV